MGAYSPGHILKNMSDFLFSRDTFTVHSRPIQLYSGWVRVGWGWAGWVRGQGGLGWVRVGGRVG